MLSILRRSLSIWDKSYPGALARPNPLGDVNHSWKHHREPIEMAETASKFALFVDVANFKPEEIYVKLDGSTLKVEGHREDANEPRDLSRTWKLPDDAALSEVQTHWTPNGQLVVELPRKHVNYVPSKTSASRLIDLFT